MTDAQRRWLLESTPRVDRTPDLASRLHHAEELLIEPGQVMTAVGHIAFEDAVAVMEATAHQLVLVCITEERAQAAARAKRVAAYGFAAFGSLVVAASIVWALTPALYERVP